MKVVHVLLLVLGGALMVNAFSRYQEEIPNIPLVQGAPYHWSKAPQGWGM